MCAGCSVFTTGTLQLSGSYFAIIVITDADDPVPVTSPSVPGFWRHEIQSPIGSLELDLSGNQLTGGFNSTLYSIQNRKSGTILNSIGNLTSLTDLNWVQIQQ
jgi:hypothetical protein